MPDLEGATIGLSGVRSGVRVDARITGFAERSMTFGSFMEGVYLKDRQNIN